MNSDLYVTSDAKKQLTDILASFTDYSSKHLPDDVVKRLKELSEAEHSEFARIIYDAMFENMDMADRLDRPVCQDTGLVQYFVRVGTSFSYMEVIEEALRDAVLKATVSAPLRHNAVEVFDERNTGTNIGHHVPWIEWELVPNWDEIEIFMYMAGGGCSLPGMAKVLMPLEGYEGIVKFVFDRVTTLGINACPPLLVGVGIAGSAEVASKLSKKALLRPIGSVSTNPRGAMLERQIRDGLDAVGIGPGGLTGAGSVMAVHIEHAARHPATLAVGISTGCWAHRRSKIRINSKLEYEVLSHQGVTL
ncbi:MAG: L(+)-tartrate dehydratase subunit alpha [Clostridiaceae bacterium]|nr:L(+)-tartrate dehydratase subunit alpha [Clostridiaceae bacterium]